MMSSQKGRKGVKNGNFLYFLGLTGVARGRRKVKRLENWDDVIYEGSLIDFKTP